MPRSRSSSACSTSRSSRRLRRVRRTRRVASCAGGIRSRSGRTRTTSNSPAAKSTQILLVRCLRHLSVPSLIAPCGASLIPGKIRVLIPWTLEWSSHGFISSHSFRTIRMNDVKRLQCRFPSPQHTQSLLFSSLVPSSLCTVYHRSVVSLTAIISQYNLYTQMALS